MDPKKPLNDSTAGGDAAGGAGASAAASGGAAGRAGAGAATRADTAKTELKDNELVVPEILNLDEHPGIDSEHLPDSANQYTIGDLHGNALRLLHFLVLQNIMEISPENYAFLVKTYKKNVHELTAEDLTSFEAIITSGKFNLVGVIRFIGDILADRGQNDFFTLIILKALKEKGINYEILLSNHDATFIVNYEKYRKAGKAGGFPSSASEMYYEADPCDSLKNLAILIDKKLVEPSVIDDIIENCYKPALKLVSYTVDPEKSKITLFMHAPNGFATLKNLAKVLAIPFSNRTLVSLAKSIDRLNSKFHEMCVSSDNMSPYISTNEIEGEASKVDPNRHPFISLIWHRNVTDIDTGEGVSDYELVFVFGHQLCADRKAGNIFFLDNFFGRTPKTHAWSKCPVDLIDYLFYPVLHSTQIPPHEFKITYSKTMVLGDFFYSVSSSSSEEGGEGASDDSWIFAFEGSPKPP